MKSLEIKIELSFYENLYLLFISLLYLENIAILYKFKNDHY